MIFLERALPLIKRGLFVIPLHAKGKKPFLDDWPNRGSNSIGQIETWNKEWPDANVGCIAANGICMLDDDTGDLAERYEAATGHKFPRQTYTVLTSVKQSGERGRHYYFGGSAGSVETGNRKKAGLFDFQENNRQVVGAGSVHLSGSIYTPVDPQAPFVTIPADLCRWIEETADAEKPATGGYGLPVAEDFDFPGLCDHYELAVSEGKTGKYFLPCPWRGGWHTDRGAEDRGACAILYDGTKIGFSCLATTCEGNTKTFRQLIAFLDLTHEPYGGKIWEECDFAAFGENLVDLDALDLIISAETEKLAAELVQDDPQKGYKLYSDENSGLNLIRMSDVRERPVDWLWKNRLPRGCGLVVSGSVGTNKSMLSTDIAAKISQGSDWPDGEKNEMGPREVLIAATEDDLETTIKPRLMAAGADMTKVSYIKNVFTLNDQGKPVKRELDITADKMRLYSILSEHPEILLVILDPLTGFFGDMDGNDNKKIRPMMQAIARICQLTGVAFILLIHENKRSEANAVDKILGAGAISQVIRAGIRVSKDSKNRPDGRKFANIKGNLSRDIGGMNFSVASKNVTAWNGVVLTDIGCIEWGEKHDQSADDVLDEEREDKKQGRPDDKLQAAMSFLRIKFTQGWEYKCDKLYDEATTCGIGVDTLKRARKKMAVDKEMEIAVDDRRGATSGDWNMGGWWWICTETKARIAGELAGKLEEAI
jgi:hypothetical protein